AAAGAPPRPPGPGGAAPAPPTEAEKIARLQRSLDADRKQLAELKRQLEDPASEYRQAQAEFTRLDGELAQLQKDLKRLRADGKAAEAAQLEPRVAAKQKEWQAARGLFDIVIEERRAVQEKVSALGHKVEHDQQDLDALTGTSP